MRQRAAAVAEQAAILANAGVQFGEVDSSPARCAARACADDAEERKRSALRPGAVRPAGSGRGRRRGPQAGRGRHGRRQVPVDRDVVAGDELHRPVRYVGQEALRKDLDNLTAALRAAPAAKAFLPSTSPSGFGHNRYYPSERDSLSAVAEAQREEYPAIVEAGFLLQIDDPWLIEILSDADDRDVRARQHVEILNHALRGIPTERIRLHACYGLNHGPRIHDVPLAEVVPWMLAIRAGAYSFEGVNPRHAHEWRVWQHTPLPDDAVLIPGFVGHATSYVEHP